MLKLHLKISHVVSVVLVSLLFSVVETVIEVETAKVIMNRIVDGHDLVGD